MTRQTGVYVDILDADKLATIASAKHNTEIKADYLLTSGVISRFNRETNRLEIRTINTEGVQDNGKVKVDEVWMPGNAYAVYTWGGYIEFTREELLASTLNKSVDLSEFIRTFGDRLERNFSLAYAWVISGD